MKFNSLSEYIAEHGTKKKFLAARLGISRRHLDGLLLIDGYQPPSEIFDIRSDLAARIGELIGQSADFVRTYYVAIRDASSAQKAVAR